VPPLGTAGAERTSRVLRWLALLVSVAAAVILAGPTWSDSGAFAVWALGLPVVSAAAAVLAGSWRHGAAVTWSAALVQLAWSLLLGLGIGLYLLPAALVEIAAAVAQTVRDRPRA
jgi:hypothetical protein